MSGARPCSINSKSCAADCLQLRPLLGQLRSQTLLVAGCAASIDDIFALAIELEVDKVTTGVDSGEAHHSLHRLRVQPDVQNGFEHARHRHGCAGANRNQQRTPRGP